MSDEITCTNGIGLISFDVSGHTAPFSLEFVIPDQGYTARVQLEGTRREERQKVPISHNLRENHAMLLFPQAGSIDIQGVNLVTGDRTPESPFHVSTLIGDQISLEILSDLKMVGIITYHPTSRLLDHHLISQPSKGDVTTSLVKDPQVLVLLSGVKSNNELFESFFIGLKPAVDFPIMEVPEMAESGDEITVTIINQRDVEMSCFLLIHDQRKTHDSLYKVLGKQVHSFLSRFADLHRKFLEFEALLRPPPMPLAVRKMKRSAAERGDIMTFAMAAPMLEETEPTLGGLDFSLEKSEDVDLEAVSSMTTSDITLGDLESTSSDQWGYDENLEWYPEVLICDIIRLQPREKKEVIVKLGDQVTTWVCRLYAFHELLFTESVKHVEATRTRYVEIRAPVIIDAKSGDRADVEVKCQSDVEGMLSIFFNEDELLSSSVNPGVSSFIVPIASSGVIRAVLQTEMGVLETEKEILEPFAQTLVYWHLVHLFPGEQFTPPQPVTVHPSPLFLLKEAALSLLQYPHGCAEQTSSKTGALAIVYKYQLALDDPDRYETLELMKIGLARLYNVFYDPKRKLFGLWSKEDASYPVTQQVLKNLVPLTEIWDDKTIPKPFRMMIENAKNSLIKKGITSFDLLPHSPEFRPMGELSDVLDVALASQL